MNVEIVQLLVSPLHRYEGRPADGPQPEPPGELVAAAEVRAGLGIVGDRYFNKRAHRQAAVTITAQESLAALPAPADLRQLRRNVLLRGADVDALIGSTFRLAGIAFHAHRAANPCAWLDHEIGPGARTALRRRGGVRCAPLSDGVLRLGPAELVVDG